MTSWNGKLWYLKRSGGETTHAIVESTVACLRYTQSIVESIMGKICILCCIHSFQKICMHLCSFLSNGTKIPFTVVLYSWLVRWYIIIIIIYYYLLLCSTYRWYLEITAASLALHCIALCCISLFIHSSIPPDERRLPQLRCCCYPW